LFELRGTLGAEVLLAVMLVKVMRDTFDALTQSVTAFRDQDAFASEVVSVHPVGWASCLPVDLVLSHDFNRLVALAAFVSAFLWLLKQALPLAPVACAASFGLLECLHLSRMFNYKHQQLVTTWVLIVVAGYYVLRHREIRDALRTKKYWSSAICPIWVGFLIGLFLGLQYTCSGWVKLQMGGLDAGSGIKMQLLVFQQNASFGRMQDVNALTRFMLEHRWFSALGMTWAVILEIGAVFAFAIKRVRPYWALGLAAMHIIVMLTMHIPFIPNTVVLLWLAVPGKQWSIAAQPVAVELAVSNRG
jgi:hypothetical protein